MSEESSGGVRSSVSRTASITCITGGSSASRASWGAHHRPSESAGANVAPVRFGVALVGYRPGGADPDLQLLGPPSPISRLCWRRTWPTIASSIS